MSSSGANRNGNNRLVLIQATTVIFITIVMTYRGKERIVNNASPANTLPTSICFFSMYGNNTNVYQKIKYISVFCTEYSYKE